MGAMVERMVWEDTELSLRLQPGEVIVSDNWRTFHNRSAFVGERHFEGSTSIGTSRRPSGADPPAPKRGSLDGPSLSLSPSIILFVNEFSPCWGAWAHDGALRCNNPVAKPRILFMSGRSGACWGARCKNPVAKQFLLRSLFELRDYFVCRFSQ